MDQLLILDGAMGSQLMARGIKVERCPDLLCVQDPDSILAIHADYINAGADAILTNTFGANPIALARYGLEDRCRQINHAAAVLAKRAAGPERYVLGDIGPSGQLPEPLGTVSVEQLQSAFAQQADALLAAGVDGFIIETMTSLEEVLAAVDGIRQVDPDVPVLVSMAFDATARGFRTMMGVDVGSMVSALVGRGIQAVGFNCGSASLEEYVALAKEFVGAVRSAGDRIRLIAEPNAGKAELQQDDRPTWKVTANEFALTLQRIFYEGVSILGGCCGTGPDHIRAAVELLRGPVGPS
jgi:5-methyltetrahydrofolate--homocysteine methyltransferase